MLTQLIPKSNGSQPASQEKIITMCITKPHNRKKAFATIKFVIEERALDFSVCVARVLRAQRRTLTPVTVKNRPTPKKQAAAIKKMITASS
mmetsp:Transcript_28362/g.40052  ORF Transcript_28362/g.40052 Transcript_28362/m.40052 type:complete len:91 (+) Transcript_28362:160-432(+)